MLWTRGQRAASWRIVVVTGGEITVVVGVIILVDVLKPILSVIVQLAKEYEVYLHNPRPPLLLGNHRPSNPTTNSSPK